MNFYCSFILKDKTQGFVIFFPDFPEATTQGDTIQECIELGEEALTITLEEYVRERKEIPSPSSMETTKQKALEQIAEDTQLIDTSFEPVLQFFRCPDISQKPVKIMVSFPKNQLEAIDKKAEKLGMTRSGFLAKAALAY